MSANNAIFIKRKTNEVFYQGCADNGIKDMVLIGKGKNLCEAVDIAQEHIWDLDGNVEYGISFI